LLVVLWLLFFWRVLSTSPINALHFREGDFSGQFVAWAAYQARELAHGNFPVWNPFNNGGHPFLADTQSAVFYPPRILILALLNAGGQTSPGQIYQALQLEAALHVLAVSLTMYAFVRRLIRSEERFIGGLVAALTFSYSGFMTGYPLLQLAVLESCTWLPLMLIGMQEATRTPGRVRWLWFAVAGGALSLSFHAGSPQFAHWSILLALAFLALQVRANRHGWRPWLIGAVLFGGIGAGLGAVQLLPGLEFYALSARRANFTFDSQGNGFPPFDVLQILLPGWVTQWSPLYVGLAGVAFAALAVWRRVKGAIFWALIALTTLLMSFGGNTIIWDVIYNLPFGFSLFRQQERAAFPVAFSAAVLAGLGAAHFNANRKLPRQYLIGLLGAVALMAVLTLVFFLYWQFTGSGDARVRIMTFSLLLAVAMIVAAFGLSRPAAMEWLAGDRKRWLQAGVVAFIVLDLFTIGHHIDNYEPGSALQLLDVPAQVRKVLADTDGIFRVDGQRGILENYGALYGVQDIRGSSPLRLDRYEKVLGLARPRLWELLAVRYVFTPDRELPVDSRIVGTGTDGYGLVNIHRLANPRPFAQLVAHTWVAPEDQDQLAALNNRDLNLRDLVILPAEPALNLPRTLPADASATITGFTPQEVVIRTQCSTAAILDLAMVYYPGWEATIDANPAPLLRANLALMAVPLTAGNHTVTIRFRSSLYDIGLVISMLTLIPLIGLAMYTLFGLIRATQLRPGRALVNGNPDQ
jgi:hypothetical protein